MTARATRRGILALAPAAALAPASAALGGAEAAPPSSHPDADLLAACAAYCALERQFIALHDEIEDDDERQPHVDALYPAMDAARDRVLDAPARTLAGLRAKLEATMLNDLEWMRDHDEALASRVFDNLPMQAALIIDLVALLKPDVPEVPRGPRVPGVAPAQGSPAAPAGGANL